MAPPVLGEVIVARGRGGSENIPAGPHALGPIVAAIIAVCVVLVLVELSTNARLEPSGTPPALPR